MTLDVRASAAEEARRGRKRGKHNHEPGYKDLLCKEWTEFMAAHHRCPRVEEIDEMSRNSFLQRRRELNEEDPDHPLLVILECPLDATQVKNLINNEKKKRQRMLPIATPQGALPLSALHGLPVSDAAAVMKKWLQSVGHPKSNMCCDQPTHGVPSPQPRLWTPHPVSCSISDQSCDAGTQKTPVEVVPTLHVETCGSPTSKAKQATLGHNTLPHTVNTFPDTVSEDGSEIRACVDKKGFTTLFHVRQDAHRAAGPIAPLNDVCGAWAATIRQCTAAEALHKITHNIDHHEALNSSTPAELMPLPPQSHSGQILSPPALSLGPSAASIVSAPAATVVQQFITDMATTSHGGNPMPTLGQGHSVAVPQIQHIVRSVVAKQVHRLFSQEQLHAMSQLQLTSPLMTNQATRQQSDPSMHQLLSAIHLLQSSQ